MARAAPLIAFTLVAGLACNEQRDPPRQTPTQAEAETAPEPTAAPERSRYDPLAAARASLGKLDNREAPIPPQCYTKTEGRANPCWVCHAPARFPNGMVDWDLQGSYSFSDAGKTNHWTNLFVDRRAAIAQISDAEILEWIRADNYVALREALASMPEDDYRGYRPDLDFAAGFDELGFARDGSGWRAFRYKPFPGAFWPTNGSADDVMIRLPEAFRSDADGRESLAVYRANLAILEASMASDPRLTDAELRWPIEAIDERAAGIDLDGDGELEAEVTQLVGLPRQFAGAAAKLRVRRGLYPKGTEFLHSVRYVDPDHGASARMKELRYSRRFTELSDLALQGAYAREAEEKQEGALPEFGGSPLTGLRNGYGWLLQGFIEDREGRLRVQTEEEQYFCMGCHSNLGVTADQSFAFPPQAARRRRLGLSGSARHPRRPASRPRARRGCDLPRASRGRRRVSQQPRDEGTLARSRGQRRPRRAGRGPGHGDDRHALTRACLDAGQGIPRDRPRAELRARAGPKRRAAGQRSPRDRRRVDRPVGGQARVPRRLVAARLGL